MCKITSDEEGGLLQPHCAAMKKGVFRLLRAYEGTRIGGNHATGIMKNLILNLKIYTIWARQGSSIITTQFF